MGGGGRGGREGVKKERRWGRSNEKISPLFSGPPSLHQLQIISTLIRNHHFEFFIFILFPVLSQRKEIQ